MVRSCAAFASAVAAATLLAVADAHSNIVFPAPYWPAGFYNGNSPIGTIDSTKFTGAAAAIQGYQGVKKLSTQLNGGDLRDFVYKNVNIDMAGATKECGKTVLTGNPYPLPAEVDFPWGHPGACAGYCDDKQFFKDEDCQGNKIGKIKVDQAMCANAKRLQVMYVGVHVEAYQVYINCVPLSGSGTGGGGAAPSPATPAAPSPATPAAPSPATPAAPSPATPAAPSPSTPAAGDDEYPAVTPKPASPPASAPAPTKKSCTKRLRK